MFSQCLGTGNIAALAAFVASAQQDHKNVSTPCKIDPVAWAIVYSKFAKAVTNGFYIAKQSDLNSGDTLFDPFRGKSISKRCQPTGKFFRLADFDHVNFNAQ